jgi:hypothetical protein
MNTDEEERRIRKIHELLHTVRAFVDNLSMKKLAEAEPAFKSWLRIMAKKIAEIDAIDC